MSGPGAAAPRLSRRLTLEGAIRVADGAGGYAIVWQALGQVWAEVTPVGARERAGESVTLSGVTYRIRVRSAPEGAPSRPRPDQRLREGVRIFRITAVSESDPSGLYLTLNAVEEVRS